MSIISISGKIGSGKDTVGRIIQYLTSTRTYEKSFIEWEEITKTTERYYAGYSSFKIHKWADILKDYVCMAIGCTREQLEDREFKDKELGEEWWYFKGYVPNVLNTKETIELVQKFITEQEAWIYIENELNYNKDICKVETIKPTPRLLLQLIGTNAIRKHVHPNYWVNCLMSEYKPIKTQCNCLATTYEGCSEYLDYPNWVISDTRFPNELKAVKDRGGISIRVSRNTEALYNYLGDKLTIKELFHQIHKDTGEYPLKTYADEHWLIKPHESETALDNAEFDYTIENNSSIIELIGKVREILIKENFIK